MEEVRYKGCGAKIKDGRTPHGRKRETKECSRQERNRENS